MNEQRICALEVKELHGHAHSIKKKAKSRGRAATDNLMGRDLNLIISCPKRIKEQG